jgi:hypothetical protein
MHQPMSPIARHGVPSYYLGRPNRLYLARYSRPAASASAPTHQADS